MRGQQHWQVTSPCPLQQGNALPGSGQGAALPRMSEGVLSMRLDISQASLCHLIAFVVYTYGNLIHMFNRIFKKMIDMDRFAN